MSIEQEGIELETINPDNDTIILPDVEDNETEADISDNTQVDTDVEDIENTDVENSVDGEKESLQRGLNKERRLRKEAEKKNKEIEARLKALEEANKEPEKSTYDTLIEGGIDEEVAKSVAKAIDSKQTNTKGLEKEIAELRFKDSLNAKSKEVGFEDILDYADEIKDLVDKGLTIEQSYHALNYDKPQTKNTKSEIERKLEAKMQNNNARKEMLSGINSNSGASKNNNKVNLSATEKAIAAAAGMTVQEYEAYKNMQSNRDYTKYKGSK